MTRRRSNQLRFFGGLAVAATFAGLARTALLHPPVTWPIVTLLAGLVLLAGGLAIPGFLRAIWRAIAAWRGGTPPATPGGGSGAA